MEKKAKNLQQQKVKNLLFHQHRKSFKAAALLLPLLGVTHLFEVYHDQPQNWVLNLIYSVVNCFLVFFNGVFLSILYCFMNNEVKNVLSRHWLSRFYDNKFMDCANKTRRRQNQNNQTEMDQTAVEQGRMLTSANTEMVQLVSYPRREWFVWLHLLLSTTSSFFFIIRLIATTLNVFFLLLLNYILDVLTYDHRKCMLHEFDLQMSKFMIKGRIICRFKCIFTIFNCWWTYNVITWMWLVVLLKNRFLKKL